MIGLGLGGGRGEGVAGRMSCSENWVRVKACGHEVKVVLLVLSLLLSFTLKKRHNDSTVRY